MNTTQIEFTVRFISIRDCKCGIGRTSTLITCASELDTLGDRRIECRGCGGKLWARSVLGVVSEHVLCGAKCLASKGPTCDCSCGGENHGASYSASNQVTHAR